MSLKIKNKALLWLGILGSTASIFSIIPLISNFLYRATTKKLDYHHIIISIAPIPLLWLQSQNRIIRLVFILLAGIGIAFSGILVGLSLESSHELSLSTYFAIAALGIWILVLVKWGYFIPKWATSRQLSLKAFSPYGSFFAEGEDLNTILELRKTAYSEAHIVFPKILISWWHANPYVLRIIHNETGEAIGYWNILPITLDTYKGIIRGDIEEREIDSNRIVRYADHKRRRLFLYIAAVASPTGSRRDSAAVILDLIAFVLDLKKRIQLGGLASWAVSDEGLVLLERFGFDRTEHIQNGKPIFKLDSKKNIEDVAKVTKKMLQNFKGMKPIYRSNSSLGISLL